MINFREIAINDKQWMAPLLISAQVQGCHLNFTNLFAWAKIYNYQIANVNDFLVVKGKIPNEEQYYYYPTGSGEPKAVLEAMIEDALKQDYEFNLFGLSRENITALNNLFPGKFEFKVMRDSFDYIYLLEKLVTLSGKKLQAKRNHINRFKSNNNWSFEEINLDNLDECWEMNEEWCKARGCENDEQLANEDCAVRRCFNYFRDLDLEGGLIRAEGKVIAYTMGDKLNSNTYDIHIEKAYGEIQGAYQMINREFAALIQKKYPEIIYVNREEDMGYEGLRKAKLSYHPERMEEKYIGIYIKE